MVYSYADYFPLNCSIPYLIQQKTCNLRHGIMNSILNIVKRCAWYGSLSNKTNARIAVVLS